MREVGDSFEDFEKKAKLVHSTDVANFFVVGSGATLSNALRLVRLIPFQKRYKMTKSDRPKFSRVGVSLSRGKDSAITFPHGTRRADNCNR